MKKILFILLILPHLLFSQMGELNTGGQIGPDTWFETAFQVLYEDSIVTIFHSKATVVIDYCWVKINIGRLYLDYEFIENRDWTRVYHPDAEEAYIYCDGRYTFLVDVRKRWLYVESPYSKMYLYGTLPEKFEIRIK